MTISEYHALKRAEELHNVMEHTAGESDRGITLIVAAHAEACLRRTLEAVLIESKETDKLFDGPYAPFGSLSGKTQAAFVMGLITKDERDKIDALRGVRNIFAHEVKASFEHPKVAKICKKEIVNSGRMIPRDEFLHMASNAVLPLLYRDLEVSGWQRPELTPEAASELRYDVDNEP
ncbi:MAG: hypothetical protein GYB15_12305 [Gammaproteobacteria bacterium]|nr:hypothetical protein [Gammaproteobacteria bacterium]